MLSTPFEWCHPLVLLSAGDGRRLGAASGGRPKLLLPLSDGSCEYPTVLDSILQAWLPRISELLVVASSPTERLERALARHPVHSSITVQPRPDGTLNALMLLYERLQSRFTVLLGDCLMQGRLGGPAQPFPGLGAWQDAPAAATRDNYGVIVQDDRVVAVQEKPERVTGELCGMGVYFLDRGFLDVVRRLPADRHGRREMTDALSFYLAQGGVLRVAPLQGDYVNINTPADLLRARRIFGVS